MKVFSLNKVYYPLVVTYVLWTIWCFVMKMIPSISSEDNLLRAFIRVSVVLIPALIYLKKKYPNRQLEIIGLKNNKKGIVWGILASLIILLSSSHLLVEYHFPIGLSKWLNWIIISPIVEEILFRSIIFKELRSKLGLHKSILLSSFFFILIHLPPILFLKTMNSSIEFFFYCGNLFILSIFFTYTFYKAKSLWGSLLPHWTNNLISMGIN